MGGLSVCGTAAIDGQQRPASPEKKKKKTKISFSFSFSFLTLSSHPHVLSLFRLSLRFNVLPRFRSLSLSLFHNLSGRTLQGSSISLFLSLPLIFPSFLSCSFPLNLRIYTGYFETPVAFDHPSRVFPTL